MEKTNSYFYNFCKNDNVLKEYFNEKVIKTYPSDHIFFEIKSEMFMKKLSEIFEYLDKNIEEGEKACLDFSKKKFLCKEGNNFNIHTYNSTFTEFIMIYLFLKDLEDKKEKALYEPKANNNINNCELKIVFEKFNLNIEVKTLNFEKTFNEVIGNAVEEKVCIFKEYVQLKEEEYNEIYMEKLYKEKLNIKKMVHYKSEHAKINRVISKANKQLDNGEKYNIVLMNYNCGLHYKEVIKCVFDEEQGIINNNNNMENIDAIVLLSLSQQCYEMIDLQHSKSNSLVLLNPKRNKQEIEDILYYLGFEYFCENDERVSKYEIYQIAVFDQFNQYVIVPYGTNKNELFKDWINFITPEENKNEDFFKLIESSEIKVTYEKKKETR